MAGHIPFLVAGGVVAGEGVSFLMLGNMYWMLEEMLEEMLDFHFPLSIIIAFIIIGITSLIVGGTLLIIGLVKYKNRFNLK